MEQGYREKKLGVGLGNLDLLYRCWEYSLGIVCSGLILISFRTYSFESGDVFNCSACISVSLCMGVWGAALPSPLLYQNVFLLLWLEPPSFLPAWAEILLLCVWQWLRERMGKGCPGCAGLLREGLQVGLSMKHLHSWGDTYRMNLHSNNVVLLLF